jgi:N-acetylneuraminic acid mutarotase
VLRHKEDHKKHGLRVLAVGGIATDASAIAGAEIYDSVSATWASTGSIHTGRNDFGLTVLRDGSVLATGGGRGDEHLPRHASAEIFDPETGKWSFTGRMATPRSEMEHAVVLLRDGRVLVPGGYRKHATPIASAEVYDPESGTWTKAGRMSDKRTGEVALVLRGNLGVLVMGGLDKEPATTASVDIGRSHKH